MHEWHERRNQDRNQNIDQDGLGGDIIDISAEASGDHSSGSGSRANQAKHCTLEDDSEITGREEYQDYGESDKEPGLECENPKMPATEAQIVRINAAISEE